MNNIKAESDGMAVLRASMPLFTTLGLNIAESVGIGRHLVGLKVGQTNKGNESLTATWLTRPHVDWSGVKPCGNAHAGCKSLPLGVNMNPPGRSLRKDAHGRGGSDSVFGGE